MSISLFLKCTLNLHTSLHFDFCNCILTFEIMLFSQITCIMLYFWQVARALREVSTSDHLGITFDSPTLVGCVIWHRFSLVIAIDMYLKVYSSYRSLVFYSHLTSWSDIVNVLQSFCYRFWASVLKLQIRSTLWQIQVRFWITSTCGKSSAQCYLFQTQLTASSRCASLRIYIFEYMIQSMSCILFQMSNSENRRCAYNFLSNIIVTTLSRWLIHRE